MASGTEHAHFPVPTCTDHELDEVFYYCKTCQRRICEKCVKGKHSEHDWTVITRYARELRMEGQQIAKKIRQEVIAALKAKRLRIRKEEEEKVKVRRTQQRIKSVLLGQIDEYADELISQLDEGDDTTDLDRRIDEFEKLAVFFEKYVKTEYDSVVIETVEELHAKLRQHEASQAPTQDKTWKFQEGTIDKDAIKSMIGRLEKGSQQQSASKLEVIVEKTIRHGSDDLYSIRVISEEKVWIHSGVSEQIYLIDGKGKELETKDCGTFCDNFIVKGSEHIFTCRVPRQINRLSSGNVAEICATKPLYPTGICQSREGDLLVCLTDSLLADISPSCKGDIHHMDTNGRIKMVYNQDKSHRTKLFTWPWQVAQNVNLDLCVSDILDEGHRSRLVVVTEDSRIKFIYKGQSSLKEKFTLENVACDSYGQILLCDRFNHAIHMLSADGQFIQFLLTSQNGLREPTALAVYGNNMWVGCANGVINLCKLKGQL